MSRLAYFTRETLISLRRNLLMTFAGIMTVAISLFLFGGILLVSRTVDHGTNKWKHGVELEIFMKVEGDASSRSTTSQTMLDDDPQRQELPIPRTTQDAYAEFKRLFPTSRRWSRATTPERAARVVPGRAEDRRAHRAVVGNEFQNEPGVDTDQHAGQAGQDACSTSRSGSGWAFFIDGRRCCSRRRCS